ncbi:flavin reductase family protein [Mycolicibacterium mengxianglii]|uniref:flavin reductase family protein n=1 Tax=Mycolicibacterium mengxianglii TaxID=2736649 RepID=UPI002FC95395
MPERATVQGIDGRMFRDAVGGFASGIVVVSANAEDPAGMTCQSFVSLSLTPPLVGFAPSVTSVSYPKIRDHGRFCVNILSTSQVSLSAKFSRRTDDKWNDVSWSASPAGNPVLDGALAWLDCTLESEQIIGDHYFTVGRVVDLWVGDAAAPALLYHRGGYSVSTPV